jgi:filamentous hemagglutinin family protein
VNPKLISVAVASCFVAGAAFANPTGPSVVNGNATIVQNGNLLQITNSPNAILNWQSFSIGANEITRFVQQSASSAVLNRIVTQNPSTILGALQSNGRVFIVNPNGILFGAGAQVDVAGLVASTLNLSDSDFLAGRMRFAGGLGAGVVNQGNITTGASGSVYLVGSAVTNNGIITSPQGEVILAAGNSVELVNPGTPNLRVEIAAADNQAINLGQILSDAGRVGIYAGLINNSGSIRADSAVSEGGRILLKATKSATLESTSVLSARGQGGGEIKVLAGDSVQVAGRLDASAPTAGHGGFIETSGRNVTIADSTVVTANAPYGKSGTWLIDPFDFVIAPQGGNISGTLLSGSLNQMSVVITSDDGTGGVNGDIFVSDLVTWTAANSLTLLARRNVTIGSSINGGGDLVFLAGWNGDLQSPVVKSGIGDITSSLNTVMTGGNVFFEAGRDIRLVSNVTGAGSLALSGNRIVQLVAGGSISMDVANIQANGGGIASVNGGSAGVTLNAGSGITLNNSIVSAIGADGISGGSGTATLVAGSGITLSGSTVSASGGAGSSGAGGNATVTLSSGGDIALASSVNARSGAGSLPGTARILLTFLTPTGNFSVNGVPGAIVDTSPGRVGEGFFVDVLPAILDVNFFVTKPSVAPVVPPSDAPAFNNVLVATMNQQVDVLGDQLKTWEIGVTDQYGQKKLSVCN